MKPFHLFLLCCLSLSAFAQSKQIDLSKSANFSVNKDVTELKFVNFDPQSPPKVVFKSAGNGTNTTSNAVDSKVLNPKNQTTFSVKIGALADASEDAFGILDPIDPANLVLPLKQGQAFSIAVTGGTQTGGKPAPDKEENEDEMVEATGLPFKDAILLKRLMADARHEKILKFYGIDKPEDNPFLKAFYEKPEIKKMIQAEGLKSSDLQKTNGVGSQAGISASAVADLLGKFIAKRFKEEMNLAYLNEFKAKLNDLTPLKLLLPATHRLLRDTDPYAYTTFLKSLQESGREDLRLAPENTLTLLNDEFIWSKVKVKANADQAVSIYGSTLTVLHTATSVYRGEQVATAIGKMNELPALAKMTTDGKNTRAAIELTALLARNFQELDGSFITFDTFKKNVDEDVILLYMGLLYHKEKATLEAITWKDQPSAYRWLADLGKVENLSKQQTTFREVRQYLDRIVTVSQTFKRPSDGTNITNFDVYHRYMKGCLDVLAATLDLSFIQPLAPTTEVKKTYLPIAQASLSLTKAIYEKQYGVALTSALNISMQLVTDDTIIPGDTRQTIIKYGTFVVTLVNADGSDQMVQALEAAALPVASYRIKRSNYFNVSLNAYGGGFIGQEKFRLDPSLSQAQRNQLMQDGIRNGFSFGATAPVGFALSWGGIDNRADDIKKAKPGDGASWTVFLPLLDVGGVFAFRLQDQTNVLPELAWKNIISPGVWITHGFRNSPLALTALAQYGPQLRTITLPTNTTATSGNTSTDPQTAQSTIKPPSWRFAVSLTADIPVFNFFTRKERRRNIDKTDLPKTPVAK